jgi:hypothetical protein
MGPLSESVKATHPTAGSIATHQGRGGPSRLFSERKFLGCFGHCLQSEHPTFRGNMRQSRREFSLSRESRPPLGAQAGTSLSNSLAKKLLGWIAEVTAMRKMTSINGRKHVGFGWKENIVTVVLAALIVIPFFAEWLYWTHGQLGR